MIKKLIGKLQVFNKEWRFNSKFSFSLAYRLQSPPTNGKQGPGGLKNISQTMLTKKKQGKNY
jgi:hypothetical protein